MYAHPEASIQCQPQPTFYTYPQVIDSSYDMQSYAQYPPPDTSPQPMSFVLDCQMSTYIPQPEPYNFVEPQKQVLRTPFPASSPRPPTEPRASSSPAPRLSRPRVQQSSASKQAQFHNPYARLAKKDEVKRRRIWNHAFEKAIFTPYELSTINAPSRRKIYISSLEHHIDAMHQILADMGHYPVEEAELDRHIGLNRKTAKSMVSGLFHDASVYKLQLLELARASGDLQRILANFPPRA